MPISLASTSGSSIHGAVVPIAYTTGTGTTAGEGINIFNIPQTYQDLMFVASVYIPSGTNYANMRWNNNNSGIYSQTDLYGNGASAVSNRVTGANGFRFISNISGISNSSTIAYNYVYHILNYTNSTTYKTVIARGANDQNGSGETIFGAGLFLSTSPITQIAYGTDVGGSYLGTNSTFALYGIRTVKQ
jgi:hypothetical protein